MRIRCPARKNGEAAKNRKDSPEKGCGGTVKTRESSWLVASYARLHQIEIAKDSSKSLVVDPVFLPQMVKSPFLFLKSLNPESGFLFQTFSDIV